MDMTLRDLQGGQYVAFFGAWEFMLGYLLAVAGGWLTYVIWVNREPGNFWRSISYTAGGRVIIGSVLVFWAEAADHMLRSFRHFYITVTVTAQTQTLQDMLSGYALPAMRITQMGLMIADMFCWLGMVLWLSAPFNTVWRGNAVLMLVAIPLLLFVTAGFYVPRLILYWGEGG